MRTLRVVRIISGLWIGGVERKIVSMLVALKHHGFDVSVVCLREDGALAADLRSQGVPVDVVRVKRRFSPTGLWTLQRFLRQKKPNIVHTHMYRSNTTGSIAAALAGVPIVINHIHNVDAWDDTRQVWTDRILTPLKDMFIFVSDAVRRNYTSRIHIPDELQRVIYNGIDTSRFVPVHDNPLDLPGSPRIGVVARLVSQKGIDSLLPMVSRWRQSAPDLKLYIMGDGPERFGLESLIAGLNLNETVRIMGFSDQVHQFLRSIDLFVMPSLKEGFSNALLEAMASGLACVATDVGGNCEAIETGISGVIVQPGDGNAFFREVQGLIESTERRSTLGSNARLRALDFSIETMFSKTAALYEELASRML